MRLLTLKRRLFLVGINNISVVLVTVIVSHINIAAHLSANAARSDANHAAQRHEPAVANVHLQQFIWHECRHIRHTNNGHIHQSTNDHRTGYHANKAAGTEAIEYHHRHHQWTKANVNRSQIGKKSESCKHCCARQQRNDLGQ